jgi:hypothetical protein
MADRLFGVPITGLDEYDVNALKQYNIEKQAQGLNLSRPEYTQGVTAFNAFNPGQKGTSTSAGYVSNRDPSVVNIYPSAWGIDYPNLLAHESAHTAEMLANRQVSKDRQNDTAYEVLARKAALERATQYKSQIQKNFQEYNKTGTGFKGAYADSKNVPWDERLADLQSLEAQLPKGKTLLDTPLGQSVFNTPELKQYWLESSIPLAIKAIPQSPQYQNIVFDKINQFNQLFKDEAKTTGYVQAALKALNKTATTKVESPMYRDPFSDTTK